MPPFSPQPPAFSLRAVLTGLLLVGAISVLSPWGILIVKGSQITSNAIPLIAVLFLFLLTTAVLPLLKMLGRAWAFSRAELIAVYTMMLVGAVVVTTGFTGSFLSVITGAAYYATPENAWQELFVEYIHPYLAPTDTEAVRLFYEGLPQGSAIPWAAWSRPLARLDMLYLRLLLGPLLPRRVAQRSVGRQRAPRLPPHPLALGHARRRGLRAPARRPVQEPPAVAGLCRTTPHPLVELAQLLPRRLPAHRPSRQPVPAPRQRRPTLARSICRSWA